MSIRCTSSPRHSLWPPSAPRTQMELRPVEGRSIELGQISGAADGHRRGPYGFRIVATLAQGETGTPVRFEAVLAPGESALRLPRCEGGASLPARSRSVGRVTGRWSTKLWS